MRAYYQKVVWAAMEGQRVELSELETAIDALGLSLVVFEQCRQAARGVTKGLPGLFIRTPAGSGKNR